MDPTWYLRRLASMSPIEIVHRTEDAAKRRLWRHRPPQPPARRLGATPVIDAIDPGPLVSTTGRGELLAAADELLEGRWVQFGRLRSDMTDELDYFADPLTGVRAPDDRYSLSIDHRDEAAVGNIKFVWEPARHQHLSALAAAYALSGDDRYATRIDAELRHYWRTNPFLVGIHWTSGIELGLRLISWTWIRRLLGRWPGAPALFEDNPVFVDQLGRHHQWLAGLGSHGSSANNHVIAEAAGQFVAATAFPLFDESAAWQAAAADELAREVDAQTFPDGLNRELASDYHGLVLDLALVAFVEAVVVGHPVAGHLLDPLGRALDALHAVVDVAGHPHRQGDSDDASGWLVDAVDTDRWRSLLATAALVVEPAPWWIPVEPNDVRTGIIRSMLVDRHAPLPPARRAEARPSLFPSAGLSLLRSAPSPGPDDGAGQDGADHRPDHDELWCLFDHGPHGFLSTAAHAHADALAVEIRSGGVEIVADPGTYCYHGERAWRDHFRSTAAHATVTLGGRDQSEMAGPFLWTRKAEATLEANAGLVDALDRSSRQPTEGAMADRVVLSRASHDGYRELGLIHRREVRLDRADRTITLVDELAPSDEPTAAPPSVQLTLPLGPGVDVELDGALDSDAPTAELRWKRADGEADGCASVTLDGGLSWRVVRGSESPRAGWYSPHFGTKVPAAAIVGEAPMARPGAAYTTVIRFLPEPPRAADRG